MTSLPRHEADTRAPIACDECLVARHAVYGALKGRDLGEVTVLRRSQRLLGSGRFIFREGEIADTVYTLYDGWAFKYKSLRNGRRQGLAVYLPGDLLVAQAMSEAPLPFSVRSLTPVTLCAFDATTYFRMMMIGPQTRQGLRNYMFDCHNETDQLLIALGRHSARSRVAVLLASIAHRMAKRDMAVSEQFHIPISQGVIGDLLGLTNVYVNRVLGQFRREGSISIARNELRILNLGALEAYAEFE